MQNIFFVSIGSNINKQKNIEIAKKLLKEKFEKIVFSPAYETKPVGFKKQEDFLNMVCRLESKKSFKEVEKILKGIEAKLKRKRTKIKSGPRTIDLDAIIWNSRIINESAKESYNQQGLKEVLEEFKEKI